MAASGHVVLVGMPGAGKSSVGRRLAKRLDRPFVDADDELVRRSGRSVRDWFAREGETAFRTAESALLADLLAAPGASVVAAGGGVVLAEGNRALLAGDRATVVWLRAGVPYLLSRVLQKQDHRPLLDEDPEAALTRLHEARTPLYAEVADHVLDVEPVHQQAEKPKKELAVRIAELVRPELGGESDVDASHSPPSSGEVVG